MIVRHLNPNHPTMRQVEEHWHKITAVLLLKAFGPNANVEITKADIDALNALNGAVMLDTRGGDLRVRILPMAEAEQLAREAGGLPS